MREIFAVTDNREKFLTAQISRSTVTAVVAHEPEMTGSHYCDILEILGMAKVF